MARHTRKGRNPGPVDEWLDTLGFYRKNVAYDETCLFRAVSEQVFACQLLHEKVRTECIVYGRNNYNDFQDILPSEKKWNDYLERLSKHMAVSGNIEMQLISRTYKRGISLFDGLKRCMKEVTNEVYPNCQNLLLCHMGEDHYDAVYEREYIQNAGHCQAIIYKTLYENVFEIPKVTLIVQAMLYQKPPFMLNHVEYFNEEINNNREEYSKLSDKEIEDCIEIKNSLPQVDNIIEKGQMSDYEYMLQTNIAPFPFKVAKALDPLIYRNIEYDTWTEMRKEMRLGDWYYGDNNFIQGSGCILKDNADVLHCYIQEILRNENKCVVYITSRAEKRTVNMSDLQPEEDAKPWPLPYRFSKNLVLSIPKVETSIDRKNVRKKRDKKRTTSKCSNESETVPENTDAQTNAYEGAPLQMQLEIYEPDNNNNNEEFVTQNSHSYNNYEYTWDAHIGVPHSPEAVVWPQSPTTPQNIFSFNTKAIVPTTPEVYADPRFFYPNDGYTQYNVWTNGEYVTTPLSQDSLPPTPHGIEITPSPEPYYYYPVDPNYHINNDVNQNGQIHSPQIEIYQPIYPCPPPGTPVYLAPAEVTELLMPNQAPLYSPAIEIPYISSPYIYPATPPAAWYPPGINSQGFIFPAVATQQNCANNA